MKKILLIFILSLIIIQISSAGITSDGFSFDTNYDFNQGDTSTVLVNWDSVKVSPGQTIAGNYLWIANADENTISKIDTSLNKEVARYLVDFQGASNPSSTARGLMSVLVFIKPKTHSSCPVE